MRVIQIAVVEQDCFGLKGVTTQQMMPPGYHAFDYPRSQAKIEEFMKWLQVQVDRGVLSITQFRQIGEAMEREWTDLYIYDSYKRGVMRARSEMIAAGMAIPSIEASGGIGALMSTPFHMDRVGILFTRTFNTLQGITDAMSSTISQILAQGMIDGDNPYVIARKLKAAIDGTNMGSLGITDKLGRFIPAKRRAEMLARTEIIRAFAEAQLNEYKNWGVLGLKLQAEFRTAGDARVCPECGSHEKKVYSLEEASGLIPLHPNCRCAWFPVIN